ncbi:MAG: hypothetical protein K0S65_4326, partial [Labilithrix sp.]|nr:hypothetical protein [Labilithrix sp.]
MSNSQSSVQLADKDARGQGASLAGASLDDLGDDDIIADGGTQIMVGGIADLGDDDIIADGGTQIMSREPSSLDALAATILAKGSTHAKAAAKFVAPSANVVAKIPPAPETAPIHELDPDDLEEDEARRMERTQPFDRARIFGAPRATGPSSAAWRVAPAPAPVMTPAPVPVAVPVAAPARPSAQHSLPSVVINEMPPAPANRPGSIAPLAIDLPPARLAPDATLKLPAIHVTPSAPKNNTPLIAGAIASGLALCAAAVIALVSFSSRGPHEDGTAST